MGTIHLKSVMADCSIWHAALRQSIAGGQYQFPQGLFFVEMGHPVHTQILREQMPRWLKGSRQVVHLDFHTD